MAMELSNQSQEILKLGKKIVEELKLEVSVDTLSRWMCHYLSEKIVQAETENNVDKKALVENECCNLILQLWDRQKKYFQSTNPLHSLNSCLEILKVLNSEKESFLGIWDEKITSDEYANFVRTIDRTNYRIIRSIFALSLLPNKILAAKNWSDEFSGLMSKEEQLLMDELEFYLQDFPRIKFTIGTEEKAITEIAYQEYVFTQVESLIDEQRKALDLLKNQSKGIS
jgi:hypothetical protein